MNTNHRPNGTILIILAAIFWSSMGIFVRGLTELAGFTSIQIVSLRLTVAALVFALILFIKNPKGFRIRMKDIPLFLGLGIGSVLFFTACYFAAIRMMTLSMAAILLYTSPIWVMLLSILFFREKLTGRKLIALSFSFLGCILVSGLGTLHIGMGFVHLGDRPKRCHSHRYTDRARRRTGLRALQYSWNDSASSVFDIYSHYLHFYNRSRRFLVPLLITRFVA